MAKHRAPDQAPFMTADAYGRSLRGLSFNLLVKDVARAVKFQAEVLGARAAYVDPDFAVMRFADPLHGDGAEWMLHADHTYGAHPLLGLTGDGALRGIGARRQAARAARGLHRRSGRLHVGAGRAADQVAATYIQLTDVIQSVNTRNRPVPNLSIKFHLESLPCNDLIVEKISMAIAFNIVRQTASKINFPI